MPSVASIFTSMACLVAVTIAMPAASPTLSTGTTPDSTQGKCPSGSATTRRGPSAMHNIFPKHPSLAKDSLGFHLETYSNASQVEQVVAFTGIPAEAKDCSFGWDQGDRIQRVFVVKGGDALSGVRQLSGFPDKAITYDTIMPFDTSTKDIGGLDMTNWDDLEPQGHITGGVDCAEALYFKIALRNGNGNTKVFLGQDESNGVYITYSC
ncbi:hypothetical protein FZEAL_2535 [Fusarium zealandicum]|uniref:Ubiquitin 3 binding protein But2 C-terminal domain-containing protein n=1 Tax=Fusarium zealandicum TaxID=1053134 RepID=A0A8H4URB3_9HYPO|nr:hypothetical protein FZEAL_2535 [Fusarium zealandicum]